MKVLFSSALFSLLNVLTLSHLLIAPIILTFPFFSLTFFGNTIAVLLMCQYGLATFFFHSSVQSFSVVVRFSSSILHPNVLIRTEGKKNASLVSLTLHVLHLMCK